MTTPLTEPRNRFVLVTESSTLNGVDFIELKTIDATTLYVHFMNAGVLRARNQPIASCSDMRMRAPA